jgi:pimeloyl-ACP methyl ester carboxylesterase
MDTTTPAATATLRVRGADLYYELRGNGPLIALHGAPMDADSFGPLGELLAVDHTVLTSDPRGINRSRVDHTDQDVTPEMRADDLAALLRHVDAGPAVVFGSSGGAVSALALTQAHPGLVDTVIAHEPPLAELVGDRDEVRRQTVDMIETYLSGDRRGAWSKFMQTANIDLPAGLFEAMFSGPIAGRAALDEHFSFAHMEFATTFWKPDPATLRGADVNLVIGIGEDSTNQLCDRTSRALAAETRVEPTMFPGGHIGFVEDPAAFATRMRDVLGAV